MARSRHNEQSVLGLQELSQSLEDDHTVFHNETYLKEMENDRNWHFSRKKLEITGKKLGRG